MNSGRQELVAQGSEAARKAAKHERGECFLTCQPTKAHAQRSSGLWQTQQIQQFNYVTWMQVQCDGPAPPFNTENWYKTKASDDAMLISELDAFITAPELTLLLKTPHFCSTVCSHPFHIQWLTMFQFEKAANTTHTSSLLIHNLQNIMDGILDLFSGHFQSALFNRESVPKIRALLDVNAVTHANTKCFFLCFTKTRSWKHQICLAIGKCSQRQVDPCSSLFRDVECLLYTPDSESHPLWAKVPWWAFWPWWSKNERQTLGSDICHSWCICMGDCYGKL